MFQFLHAIFLFARKLYNKKILIIHHLQGFAKKINIFLQIKINCYKRYGCLKM